MVGVTGSERERVALYDTVSGFAFGPTFRDRERALDFLAWWTAQAYGPIRKAPDRALEHAYELWRSARLDSAGELVE